jgi:hypothetical protein
VYNESKKIKKDRMKKKLLIFALMLMFVFPASSNYRLKDYGFGSGGAGNASSPNYSMNAISGEMGAGKETSASYGIGTGLNYTNQANVPTAPTFDNPNNYYNRLRLIISPSGNPSSAKFAIAISSDNFVTTKYVQNDNTVGNSLGLEDYQTYASWGGANGIYVIGLSSGTTYSVKAKAITGKFTETAYGPSSSATTANPTLSFDIDVSSSDSETSSPYGVNFGSLTAGAVNNSPQRVWVDFSTNGEMGGKVYISSLNGGLKSAYSSHLIVALTGNLAAVTEGFGAQVASMAQSSGGPLTATSIYSQSADVVGMIDPTVREIFSSVSPITGGRGSFFLKAKSSMVTPAANDYSETFTMTASGSF